MNTKERELLYRAQKGIYDTRSSFYNTEAAFLEVKRVYPDIVLPSILHRIGRIKDELIDLERDLKAGMPLRVASFKEPTIEDLK